MDIRIKQIDTSQIPQITKAFENTVWDVQETFFERFLAEQEMGKRTVLVAYGDNDFAGFVTILWRSNYQSFAEKGIPEINDLRVIPDFRRRGIATALVDEAEKRIFERSPVAGIGFGLYADYGAAQRMYILRGYIPDGLGISYKGKHVEPGKEVLVDDDLVLYLTKECGA
ncbi:GNAT family N-acetyltransferase [Chloroflexota bacterium]